MYDNGYKKIWIETGKTIAGGGRFGLSDLYAIYDNMDISHILPDYLISYSKYEMSISERKKFLFELAGSYWGLTENDWIEKERYWFRQSLELIDWLPRYRLTIQGVASIEILFNLIVASKIVTEDREDGRLSWEVVNALNLTVGQLCSKGRTMMAKAGINYVLNCFFEEGLLIGSEDEKFLPYPEKSLPELLLMLNRKTIPNQTIYDNIE